MSDLEFVSGIDLIVVVGYLLGIVTVGFFASRKISDSSDYAVAGRQFSFPVLCGTLIGSTIGAASTMGKAGKAYEAGYAVLYASIAYFLGYILLAFLAPKLRAARIDSMPDVLQRRFGAGMRIMAAFVLLFVVVPTVGIQLIACALIVSNFLPDLGLTYAQIVVISAAIIVLYTLMGGLFAVAYTDLIQVIIMIVGIGILLPVFLIMDLGSALAVSAALVPPPTDWLGGMSLDYVLAFIPIFTAFVLIDAGAWQRIAAAKNAEDLKPAMFLTAGFFGFWSVLVVGLGVVAFNTYPDLVAHDTAIPQMVIDYMPPLLLGICLAAILALIMSTADTALLISGTTVSWDIVRVLRPDTQDKILLSISRFTVLIVGGLAVAFALSPIPLFEINLMVLGIFVAGLFVPVMASLFFQRATSAGAVAASVFGVAPVVILYGLQFYAGKTPPVQPILAGLSFSAVAFILVSRLTWSKSHKTVPVLRQTSMR